MIETILVATDGSDDASAAESMGMGLASRLGARISGVSIIDDRLLPVDHCTPVDREHPDVGRETEGPLVIVGARHAVVRRRHSESLGRALRGRTSVR